MSATSVRMQRLPDGTMQWTIGSFVASLRVLGPGVVYCCAVGSGEHIYVPELTAAMEAEIAMHGRIAIFVNLLEAARLSGAARDSWAAWAKQHKDQTSAHFLVRSKLVEMGLSLIGMFSGADLRSYADAERFSSAMQHAAPNAVLPKLRNVA